MWVNYTWDRAIEDAKYWVGMGLGGTKISNTELGSLQVAVARGLLSARADQAKEDGNKDAERALRVSSTH